MLNISYVDFVVLAKILVAIVVFWTKSTVIFSMKRNTLIAVRYPATCLLYLDLDAHFPEHRTLYYIEIFCRDYDFLICGMIIYGLVHLKTFEPPDIIVLDRDNLLLVYKGRWPPTMSQLLIYFDNQLVYSLTDATGR